MGAAAASVVAIAVVGDLFSGTVAATVMSRLMLVLGVAPVLAPSLGAAVLLHGSWHWVFVALVVVAGGLLVMAALALPETLPVSHRRPLAVRGIIGTYAELLRDARFVILVLVAALGMSGLFAYISAAPFVLQGDYGLDQQAFALVFAAGAIALIGSTQFNVVLLRRFSPQAITVAALSWSAFAGRGVRRADRRARGRAGGVRGAGAGDPGRDGPGASQCAPALALSRHPDAAGTAAALLGAAQFGLGAAVAPAIGALGNGALALSWVMTAGMAIALVALLLVGRRNGDEEPRRIHGRHARRRSGGGCRAGLTRVPGSVSWARQQPNKGRTRGPTHHIRHVSSAQRPHPEPAGLVCPRVRTIRGTRCGP